MIPASNNVTNVDYVRRIALVISQLRPGGAERVMAHLATTLQKVGVDPLVICIQNKGQLAPELEGHGIAVRAFDSTRGYDVATLFKLNRTLRGFGPSVIHVHDYSSLPYVALANILGVRRPLVFTAHGLLYEGFEHLQARYRFFARGIDTLAAVSPQVRDRHIGYLNWQGATALVPNGVPDIVNHADAGPQVRQELGVSPDAFVFLSVGNPRSEKGFEDLLSAAVSLRQMNPRRPFHVWIAGTLADTEYCRNLRNAVAAADIPNFQLLGYRDDATRLYAAADALVIPSHSEGLPMVLLEAMTAGLPVIATRIGGIPDAVPERCGHLVEPRCPRELADAMACALAGDSNYLKKMGSAAREHALSEFGVERMANRYVSLYAGLLRLRGGANSQ